ncbi:MAG: extracellular solute-binding protein [Actinobacteria bacterium]|nr:MAG: extracellular solute-binding protein [Actinomycetota bacterium]
MKGRHALAALALVLVAAVVSALVASASYGGKAKKSAASIEVFSLWGGSEQDAFIKVTKQFTKDTGIDVKYTSGRDFTTDIGARLAAGNPPDIAIVPRPGYLASLARKGVLKNLGTMGFTPAYMKARYGSSWIGFGTVGGKLYGLPAKANSKSVIWYRPQTFKKYKLKAPTTWKGLVKLTKTLKSKGLVPWAVGDGPNQSQWVLTDWFESIYVRTAGPAKYQALFTGKLPFTDPSVASALKTMTQIINNKYVLGGIQGMLGQSFVGGIGDVFGKSPKAHLYYEGGFVGGIAIGQVNTSLKPGVTINDFTWPSINPKWGSPVTIGGDYAVAFKDSANIRKFLQYITSGAAGKIWVSTGAIISPNKQVKGSAYPNVLVRREGAQLAGAKVIRFDGSDQMPGAFGDTWGFALQKIAQNPSTSNVKKILSNFQKQIKGQWGS